MANLPSNRNLLIPGKNALGSDYKKDAQTIEQWARQPIQRLIAGSGITLSPASGLATDSKGHGPNPITISASGGGGGGPAPSGWLGITFGPDAQAWSSGFVAPFGDTQWQNPSAPPTPDTIYVANMPLWNNPGTQPVNSGLFTWGSSWMTFPGVGAFNYAITVFPTLWGPVITSGGPIHVQLLMWAVDMGFTNYLGVYAAFTLSNLQTKTLVTADVTTMATTGADLSLAAGSNPGNPSSIGSGIVSGGAVAPYLGGTQVTVNPNGAQFA